MNPHPYSERGKGFIWICAVAAIAVALAVSYVMAKKHCGERITVAIADHEYEFNGLSCAALTLTPTTAAPASAASAAPASSVPQPGRT